jgi:histone H3/H4
MADTNDTNETGESGEMLLVASKVREQIKAADCNTAGDALAGLNNWVHWLIKQATARAKENGRKTVRGHDFMIP